MRTVQRQGRKALCLLGLFFCIGVSAFGTPNDTLRISPQLQQRIFSLVHTINTKAVRISPPPFTVAHSNYAPAAFAALRSQLYRGNLAPVRRWVQQALTEKAVRSHAETTVLAKSLWIELLFVTEAYGDAYKAASELERFADSANVQNKEEAYLPMARAAFFVQDYSSANAIIEKVLELARKNRNKAAEAKAHLAAGTIARAYFYGTTHRAIPYYEKAIRAAQESGDTLTLIRALLLKHSDIAQPGDLANGFPYLEQAAALVIRGGYLRYVSSLCEHICTELRALDRLADEPALLLQSLAASRRFSMPLFETHAYIMLCENYSVRKKYDSAVYYISQARNEGLMAPGALTPNLIKARVYREMGDYEKAAALYDAGIANYLNTFVLQGQNSISRWETKLRMQDKEMQLQQVAARRRQLISVLAGICLVLAVTLLAYLRQRSLRKRLAAQNQTIVRQSEKLQASLNEKDLLLKEIHHRVKNNLQVISGLLELQTASAGEDAAVKAAIVEGQNRIKSIALIHQRLYQHDGMATIELGGFVAELFTQIASALKAPGQEIQTTFDIPETHLDIDTAVPLGLICNEVITNAFKHSFANQRAARFDASLRQHAKGGYELRLSDNGTGLPTNVGINKTDSLGLKLIRRLSRQIGGEADYRNENGATFIIRFPNPENETFVPK